MKLSGSQFGGLKGAGVDHFLVETFDEVLTSLEDNRASVNLMSIDFEKAFNRMCHTACLEALSTLGADPGDIALVRAFLSGRTMSVKIDDSFSLRRSVPGGSPQGSILGNFLFCATTDMFNRVSATPVPRATQPSPDPTRDVSHVTGSSNDSFHTANGSEYDSDENVFRFARSNPVNVLYDHEQSVRFTQDEIDEVMGVPERWENKPCCTKAYIDDLNIIEKVRHSDAISITSANKRVTLAHAPQSEAFFHNITCAAENIKMKVNEEKTQLVAISASKESIVKTYINTGETRIESTDRLKILGFWFGTRPGVSLQVEAMQEKFRKRVWTLFRLKKSGLSSDDLLFFYNTVIRPVFDFCAVTYHSMLTREQTEQLERLQKCAFRVIYSYDLSYQEALAVSNSMTLEERRKGQLARFAQKKTV